MEDEYLDVISIFLENICVASPCNVPIEIKKLIRRAKKDKKLAEQLKALGKENGIEVTFDNDIEAYLAISKLANKICSSLI